MDTSSTPEASFDPVAVLHDRKQRWLESLTRPVRTKEQDDLWEEKKTAVHQLIEKLHDVHRLFRIVDYPAISLAKLITVANREQTSDTLALTKEVACWRAAELPVHRNSSFPLYVEVTSGTQYCPSIRNGGDISDTIDELRPFSLYYLPQYAIQDLYRSACSQYRTLYNQSLRL